MRLLILAVALFPWIPHRSAVAETVRVATFNIAMYGGEQGQIVGKLAGGKDEQAIGIAKVVRAVRPDVLLINELDYDRDGEAARRLNDQYFAANIDDAGKPIRYPHRYAAQSNTGVPSGLDLNDDGDTDDPEDAWGYGKFPGQYAMTVFSRYPIDRASIRTFANFKWKDLPGASRPAVPDDGQMYHDDEIWRSLRLSSKNHIDVPVQIGETVVHVLGSHPTPPVFDGPEDLNGLRNADEVRFWNLYLDGSKQLVDDAGAPGGLDAGELFVIVGDLNADPVAGDGVREAIAELLSHPRVTDPKPVRVDLTGDPVAVESAKRLGTIPRRDGGTLRIDYVLPCKPLRVAASGVVWPTGDQLGGDWVTASDHRMVWVDVELP